MRLKQIRLTFLKVDAASEPSLPPPSFHLDFVFGLKTAFVYIFFS